MLLLNENNLDSAIKFIDRVYGYYQRHHKRYATCSTLGKFISSNDDADITVRGRDDLWITEAKPKSRDDVAIGYRFVDEATFGRTSFIGMHTRSSKYRDGDDYPVVVRIEIETGDRVNKLCDEVTKCFEPLSGTQIPSRFLNRRPLPDSKSISFHNFLFHEMVHFCDRLDGMGYEFDEDDVPLGQYFNSEKERRAYFYNGFFRACQSICDDTTITAKIWTDINQNSVSYLEDENRDFFVQSLKFINANRKTIRCSCEAYGWFGREEHGKNY